MPILLFIVVLLAAQPAALDVSSLSRLLSSGEREQARTLAAKILAQSSRELRILLDLGRLLGAHKEFGLAEQALRRAAELEPQSFEAHFNHGLTLYQANRASEAKEPLRKAVALNASSFEANYLLGVVSEQDESIRHLRKALALRPGHPAVITLLGVAYVNGEYYADAIETLERAPRLEPSDPNLSLLLARAYHENYEFEKALAIARASAAKFSDSANAHFRLGYELEANGQFAEAQAAYLQALKLQPGHPEASAALGRWKLRTGQPAEALLHFEAALRSVPSDFESRLGLAKALFAAKQYQRAKSIASALAQERPDEPAVHLLLSQIYQVEGNAESSRQEQKLFLELSGRASRGGGMSSNLPARKTRRFVP